MTAIFKIYLQAWRETFQHWKMWGLLYVLNILFALIIILPFKDYFENTLGNSLALDKILQDFDFDVFTDLLTNYGQGLGVLSGITPVVLVGYLLLSTFTMGGILESFQKQSFKFSSFWSAGSRYFWRMLRLAIYFLLAQVLLLGFALFLFNFFAKGFSMDELQSEVRIIEALFGVGIPYILLAAVVFMLHDYVKVQLIHTPNSWLTKPFRLGIRFALRHFLKTYPLYLLNALIAFGIFALYKSVEMQLFTTSAGKIFALLLLGQLFILFRIGARLVVLSSANYLFEKYK